MTGDKKGVGSDGGIAAGRFPSELTFKIALCHSRDSVAFLMKKKEFICRAYILS